MSSHKFLDILVFVCFGGYLFWRLSVLVFVCFGGCLFEADILVDY